MTHRLTRAATARNPVARFLRNTALRAAGRLRPVRRAVAMNLSELSTDPDPRRRSGAGDTLTGSANR